MCTSLGFDLKKRQLWFCSFMAPILSASFSSHRTSPKQSRPSHAGRNTTHAVGASGNDPVVFVGSFFFSHAMWWNVVKPFFSPSVCGSVIYIEHARYCFLILQIPPFSESWDFFLIGIGEAFFLKQNHENIGSLIVLGCCCNLTKNPIPPIFFT